MLQMLQATLAADISDAADTTQFTIEAPYRGVLRLDECFVRWSEATGTQTTTRGVISITVAGTEVATLTANVSDAVGQTQKYTAAGEKYIEFDAGDAIVLKTKTQAVDGTIIGDGDVTLSLEWGV